MSNQIPKHLQEKKKHHYVWGHYLKNWSTDIDKKFVWRRTKKNNKVEKYTISGMLYEDSFYKINNLDTDHIQIINHLFYNSHPKQKEMIERFITHNLLVQKAEVLASNNRLSIIESRYLSVAKSNTLENIHSDIENNMKEILSALVNQDLSILNNDENMIDFINFIAHQATRTKPLKEFTITNINKKSQKLGSKLEECWWLVSYFSGVNLGASLWQSRKRDSHCLLINETEEPFITSDHPVLNVHPSIKGNSLKPLANDELDLYYPISPKIAYMINNSNRFKKGIVYIPLETVIELNEKIAKMSNIHIIGNTEQVIHKYKKHVGNWMEFIRSSS